MEAKVSVYLVSIDRRVQKVAQMLSHLKIEVVRYQKMVLFYLKANEVQVWKSALHDWCKYGYSQGCKVLAS